MIHDITPVIIAANAEHTMPETLDSLEGFAEVVLYLNNSDDDTREIASGYSNVTVVDGAFMGFGPTKNRAVECSGNDWVLSLDSDEVASPELCRELASLELKDPNEVFIIKRDNYLLGKVVRHGGWGKDYLLRLYNRTMHRFNDNEVHESVQVKEPTVQIRLKNSFKHNAVTDLNQFLQKVMSYSDLASKDRQTRFFGSVLLRAQFAFFKSYVLRLGFLEGWRGVVIAVSEFNGRFFRYAKRYLNEKER